MNEKPLLILDLDETLIHATANRIREDFDFQIYQYFIYQRPGLVTFLTQCDKHFDLAVWSSASDDYVQAVVRQVFPTHLKLAFVWGRSRCTRFRLSEVDEQGFLSLDYAGKYEFAKRLRKVTRRRFDLKKMLIVDDTPEKVSQHYGNAIYIKPLLGERDDQELFYLATYLLSLRAVKNVRTIEKRYWRDEVV
ncbi:phosphoprotein phosphatase [Hymenobacter psoromatis]|nr:phosphoprotein phosphatase [Hymenobacter psoromatis]